MFDFLDNDYFNIILQIVFLLFIAYDTKKYFQTRQKQYLINIALTLGFFIWAIVPFYNKYMTWDNTHKSELKIWCEKDNNISMCKCLDDKVFKEYSYESYKAYKSKTDSDLKEFLSEVKKECLEDLN